MRSRLLVLALLALAGLGYAGAAGSAGPDPAVRLRQRFFGLENVDPVTGAVRADRVILSWFGVTNFAAAIGGHVVLLDAWVPRGEYSGYVPTSPAELAALRPEAIFIGHGHFDHAADAAEIAGASGAVLVGTSEHCAQVRAQGAAVSCVEAVPSGSTPGAVRELDVLAGVGITALRHVHSAAEPPDPSDPHAPAAPPPDPSPIVLHPPAPQDTLHLFSHLGDAEGGTVLYQFRVGSFALAWHDSSGPLPERAPQVLDALRGLPPTDVQVGAIMGFNQLTNGLRDPRLYVEALHPKVFVPAHHDNWAPPVSTRAERYRPALEEELARIPEDRRPELRFIGDPQDYLRPQVLTFHVGDAVWS